MKRRKFMQVAGMTMVGATTALSQGDPTALKVRKSALQLSASDPVFAQYASAVKAMHALPATDRRNWGNQAKIHADFCTHGTSGFMPWHRHYLLYFEQICASLIGDPNFALPYWDWSFGTGKVPDAFFDIPELTVQHWNDPGQYVGASWGTVNSRPIRAIGKGVGVQTLSSGGAFLPTTINNILSESSYNVFRSRVEGTPHNSGHVAVGFPATGLPGHIGDGLSPLDPLFWLHHCNVDRLWAQWQLAGNQSPVFNAAYNANFVNAGGSPVNVTADAAKDFVALGYTYDSFGDPNALAKLAGIIPADAVATVSPLSLLKVHNLADTTKVLGSGKPAAAVAIAAETRVSISVAGLKDELAKARPVLDPVLPPLEVLRAQPFTKQMVTNFGKPEQRPRRIMAHVKGLQSAAFTSDPVVNVFVNCPYLTPATGFTDPHYAGTFSLFGASAKSLEGAHQHQHASQEFYIDLTNAVRGLNQENLDKLDVQFMTLAGDVNAPGKGTFTVESVEIISL